MKRARTSTIIQALRILAAEIRSEDGIASGALLEAADRMQELVKLLEEVSGPFSYGRWSLSLRRRVERAVK